MIFLIQYDRATARMVRFERFGDAEREAAKTMRLRLELEARSAGVDHELVLLEASSEEDIRRTHRRYFESLEDLADDVMAQARVARR